MRLTPVLASYDNGGQETRTESTSEEKLSGETGNESKGCSDEGQA